MRNRLYATVLFLFILIVAKPASACRSMAELKLEDITYASVVVVGRITNYEIILDQEARMHRERTLANPELSPEYRELISGQKNG